jgi:hypothetical protein
VVAEYGSQNMCFIEGGWVTAFDVAESMLESMCRSVNKGKPASSTLIIRIPIGMRRNSNRDSDSLWHTILTAAIRFAYE